MEETAQSVQTADASTGYRVFSTVRTILVYLTAALIIIAAAFFAADKSPNKALFGFRYYVVLTDSMAPTYRSGDMVFVKLQQAESIQEGDVITFNPSANQEAYLTHRVIQKLPDYQGTGVTCFRTKGDANDVEDSFLIDESRVIGTVKLSVPKMGIAIRFIQMRWYFILPLIILLFVFFSLMRKFFELRNEPDMEESEIENEEVKS